MSTFTLNLMALTFSFLFLITVMEANILYTSSFTSVLLFKISH